MQETSSIALPPYSLRQGSQSNPELTDTPSLIRQLTVGILSLHLPRLELQAGFHAHIYVGSGDLNSILTLG